MCCGKAARHLFAFPLLVRSNILALALHNTFAETRFDMRRSNYLFSVIHLVLAVLLTAAADKLRS